MVPERVVRRRPRPRRKRLHRPVKRPCVPCEWTEVLRQTRNFELDRYDEKQLVEIGRQFIHEDFPMKRSYWHLLNEIHAFFDVFPIPITKYESLPWTTRHLDEPLFVHMHELSYRKSLAPSPRSNSSSTNECTLSKRPRPDDFDGVQEEEGEELLPETPKTGLVRFASEDVPWLSSEERKRTRQLVLSEKREMLTYASIGLRTLDALVTHIGVRQPELSKQDDSVLYQCMERMKSVCDTNANVCKRLRYLDHYLQSLAFFDAFYEQAKREADDDAAAEEEEENKGCTVIRRCAVCQSCSDPINRLCTLDPCGHELCRECFEKIRGHKVPGRRVCPYCREVLLKAIPQMS